MPLAKKPVASPFSALFEARKNSSFSKDAKDLFRGGVKGFELLPPLIQSNIENKRRSAVSCCHGTTGWRFFVPERHINFIAVLLAADAATAKHGKVSWSIS